jgi:hypothetical protein
MTAEQMRRLGFHVWHRGGVCRAWERLLSDGSYILVTDVGGYDLPDPAGPYSGWLLSAADSLLECRTLLQTPRQLCRWLRHADRIAARRGRPGM